MDNVRVASASFRWSFWLSAVCALFGVFVLLAILNVQRPANKLVAGILIFALGAIADYVAERSRESTAFKRPARWVSFGLVLFGAILVAGFFMGMARDRYEVPLNPRTLSDEEVFGKDDKKLSLNTTEDQSDGLLRKALHGDAHAQLELAHKHFVNDDFVAAAKWMHASALQGNAEAQLVLGLYFQDGRGVQQDLGRAVGWWEQAAAQGRLDAITFIANAYLEGGAGLRREPKVAIEWLERGTDAGSASAPFELAMIYYLGKSVPKDWVTAAQWAKVAAAKGDSSHQEFLADLYWRGHGVRRDNVLAYAWYNLAAANEIRRTDANSLLGDAFLPSSRRDELAKTMTTAEIAEGQRLSTSWKKGQDMGRSIQQSGLAS
jgi:TPR repeat protein